ncbi:MAG TPA: asparagine synthase (glutamine-hydrolyzing) [Candidatus Eisenbacteria bacterium]|nr:asparagine synthase (glutamine-hydrolyzing) [Candidatus Eisenbacteria bacterium]
MCGIAGVYALTERPPDPAWGAILARALAHRGPDGSGVYHDDRVVLAHTRLAIIDLSEGGRQPMASADDRRRLVLNGEIYNHAELRPGLEAEGARFRSRSDTEVFLELLTRRGRDGLARARGMFAFALYDRSDGTLLLGRDRLGKKPLLWTRAGEYVAFASEAAALLALPFVRARLDAASLADYLRYLYVPAPATLLRGIAKLPPASLLALRPAARGADPAEGVGEPERYWAPPEPGAAESGGEGGDGPGAAWARELEARLDDATRLRTVSDVPIGVFLSGGVDSNVVLERLRHVGHRPIRAYTVGFEGLPDESDLAALGAARNADEHKLLSVRPDVARDVPAILRSFGEPIGDSAIVTTWLVAREAAKEVKVILNGDGGDELFGGYARYPFARRLDLARGVRGGAAAARAFYGRRPELADLWEPLEAGDYERAARAISTVTPAAVLRDLLAPAFLEAGTRRDAAMRRDSAMRRDGAGARAAARSGDLAAAVAAWDAEAYLPDDLLVKVDLASMAHALENRSPFLDHELWEHVAALPPARRFHWRATKPLLRRFARGRIPDEALNAPKRGFQLPLDAWLRGALRPWLDDLLRRPEATRPLYREGATERLLDAFHSGSGGPLAPYRLWALATLEIWAREFHVDVVPAGAPAERGATAA